MKIIYEKNADFKNKFNILLENRSINTSSKIDSVVKKILYKIKNNGDDALVKLTNQLDKTNINKNDLLVSYSLINNYSKKIKPDIFKNFKIAIRRIKDFHKKQFPKNYSINKKGIKLSSRWIPIQSVGLYVPGGAAPYPSSLIMNIIPAKIAGVKRIVVTSPSTKGKLNPYMMAILKLLDIREFYQVGGAQAIAALAYGTKTIKPVDKIFGPGNSYVNSAKKQVFGKVGIDLIAGPSEVLVVADKNNNADWVASDLMAQAEHDIMSKSILITDNKTFAKNVKKSIDINIKNLSRSNIIKKSIKNYGTIIVLKSLNNVHNFINRIAPEHLHLQCSKKKLLYSKVINAGCVFLGEYATESIGDYVAGTNHVLPTGGTSRFASGLGVLDFMKKNSCIEMDKKGFNTLSSPAEEMAEVEGLDAHKFSIQIRRNKVY